MSQNVGIGTTTPDASAQLEIQSTDGGVLIPRLSTTERNAISNPAIGLLIYNATLNRFEFHNGIAWEAIGASGTIDKIADLDADTYVQAKENATSDYIQFDVEGSEALSILRNTNGVPRLEIVDNVSNSIAIGEFAGNSLNNDSQWNVIIGKEAGENQTGDYNVIIGGKAGELTSSGSENVKIGVRAGQNNAGNENTFLGRDAGRDASGSKNVVIGKSAGIASGDNNVLIGLEAGTDMSGANNTIIGNLSGLVGSGDNNTFLGTGSGENARGSGNVFIGKGAGADETGNNRMYIDNNNDATPLIYGEFDNSRLLINRKQTITSGEFFGVTAPTNGFGGMYMETKGLSSSKPFYGFAINGIQASYIYHDGGTDEIKFHNDGDRLSIKDNGRIRINNQYELPSIDGTSGQSLTTDGSGNLSWSNAAGAGHFEVSSGTVRQLSGYNQNFLFGKSSMPSDGQNAVGSFFFFEKDEGAFRGGTLSGNEFWSPSNTGSGSFAYGYDPVASGNYSNSLGFGTVAQSLGETVLGIYNEISPTFNASTWQPTDALFTVGNGENFLQRSNAMTIYKNGHTQFKGLTEILAKSNDAILSMTSSSGSSSTDSRVIVRQNNTEDVYLGDVDANGGNVILRSNGIDGLTIDQSQNIGVGEDDPTSKLHISSSSSQNAMQVDIDGISKLVLSANGGLSIGGSGTPPADGLIVGNLSIFDFADRKLRVTPQGEIIRDDEISWMNIPMAHFDQLASGAAYPYELQIFGPMGFNYAGINFPHKARLSKMLIEFQDNVTGKLTVRLMRSSAGNTTEITRISPTGNSASTRVEDKTFSHTVSNGLYNYYIQAEQTDGRVGEHVKIYRIAFEYKEF